MALDGGLDLVLVEGNDFGQAYRPAVTHLLFSGTFTKFKDIRFIFTHAGGDVAMVLGRMHQYGPKNTADKAPNGIEYELKRLYGSAQEKPHVRGPSGTAAISAG